MTDQSAQDFEPAPRMQGGMPRFEASIVPRDSVSGRALIAVVAIMTFLASLTAGAVMLVRASASEWQSDLAREVTIQVLPAADRDIDAAVERAASITRAFPGVSNVRPYSKEESARLLEPWLGTGLSLDELPVPRLIVVTLARGNTDLAQLRTQLAAQVTGATLDDHRGWIDRMRAMSASAVAGGIAILILMVVATMLSVTFATRGAMASNKPVIEVLHLVGARNNFIAGHFQRHFLVLGLKGGAIGGAAAVALFAFAGLLSRLFSGTAGGDQATAMFGSFSIGTAGYIAVIAQVALIAAVTAQTSRRVVNRTLDAID